MKFWIAALTALERPLVRRWIWAGVGFVVGLLTLFLIAAETGLATAVWVNFPDWETVQRGIRNLPATGMLLLFFVTPLVGVPLSFFLVLIGYRFGWLPGAGLAFGVLLAHHALGYLALRGRAGAFLRRRIRWAVPDYRQASTFRRARFIVTTSLFPGPAYVLKLVYGASAGVPFLTYVAVGVLAQMALALPYLILGVAFSGDSLLLISGVLVGIIIASAVIQKLAERRSKAQASAAAPASHPAFAGDVDPVAQPDLAANANRDADADPAEDQDPAKNLNPAER